MSEERIKRNYLELKRVEGVSEDRQIAQAFLSTETMNASAAVDWAQRWHADLSLNDSIAILRESAEKVKRGDLSELEATLVSQARTLDTIFTSLADRAANTQNLAYMESALRLALKAQAQSRSTIEALHEIKHPHQAFFIGQQNIAERQQVNNATCTRTRTQGRKIRTDSNKLLEAYNGERLDGRTAQAAIGADPRLEAVGEINRRNDQ